MGKLYAMRKYVESFRHRDEETPAAAAMQLSDIHTAQEEGIQQQEIEKKSAHPKTFQGELSSKKLLSKNYSSHSFWRRKVFLVLKLFDLMLLLSPSASFICPC